LPHIIIGDFDSIRPEVKDYYENKGVKIFHNKDQNTTDLEKCVYYVFENSENLTKYDNKDSPKNVLMRDNSSYTKLIILGAFGGRIDQTLASIHVLYKMNSYF
jgi:thiamine pyrophosphokinase